MADGKMGRNSGRLRQEMIRTVKEEIKEALLAAGASAVGFARAGATDAIVSDFFEEWMARGYHAGMDYLERHRELRRHTDHVLPGAQTAICLAFSYVPEEYRDPSLPGIACYAYGEDYHKALRKRLKPLVTLFKQEYGGDWRICIDSAPVEERYLAVKSGIGRRGINGAVIVEGCGSLCFLAEILTTLVFEPDTPAEGNCMECGICVKKCPTGALLGNGIVDARRCISYLTIEKKGEYNEEEKSLMESLEAPGFLFGCDICLRVCPHNKDIPPTRLPEFRKLPGSINEKEVCLRRRGRNGL